MKIQCDVIQYKVCNKAVLTEKEMIDFAWNEKASFPSSFSLVDRGPVMLLVLSINMYLEEQEAAICSPFYHKESPHRKTCSQRTTQAG